MRIILYCWGAYNDNIFADELKRLGHSVFIFSEKCNHYTRDVELAYKLIAYIHETHADAVVSFNYFPIISLACDSANRLYYSWVYDNPHSTLYAKTVNLPCNRIGVFDRGMVDELNMLGINSVFHLPLATSVNCFDKVISSMKPRNDICNDVSFIGSMYSDSRSYFDVIYDNPIIKKEITEIVSKYVFSGNDYMDEVYKSKYGVNYIVEKMHQLGLFLGEDYIACSDKIAINSVIERYITALERYELFSYLSANDMTYSFSLFTDSNTDIKHNGCIDYHNEMPVIFRNSKININLTLKSIHKGIPLRALDIMACGGFLLTNKQEEMDEYFIEGEHLAYYSSKEECDDKIRYYLKNEDIRKQIANKGKAQIRTFFNYERCLKRLFEY